MRKSKKVRRKFRLSLATWRAPAIIGLAIFLGFPSVAAYADLATFLSGINRGANARGHRHFGDRKRQATRRAIVNGRHEAIDDEAADEGGV